jgi:hypothetical protein
MVPKDYSKRSYDLSFITPAIARLTLTAFTAEITHRTGRQQTIPIKWDIIRGIVYSCRPTFQCQCGGKAFKLYAPYGGNFVCRKCAKAAGVIYASQAVHSAHRAHLQSIRLRRFLGNLDNTVTPAKPRFWHRRTHRRLLAKLAQYEAKLPRHRAIHSKQFTHHALRPTNAYRTQIQAARI